MRVVFFGTSGFAVPTLLQIRESGHLITSVVTQPARPGGRGLRAIPSPVETAARQLGLPVWTPDDPNDPGFLTRLREESPEVGVLVAYGCILRPALLELPARGFTNLHPSLLPKYRGAAPIQRALMHGEEHTGISVCRMTATVDAGDILAQEMADIGPDETAGELSERLARAGAALVAAVLGRADIEGIPQRGADATRAPKIRKPERTVDWARPSAEIHNRIRALSPEPGAVARFRGARIVLLRSRVAGAEDGAPGTIVAAQRGLVVTAQAGALELLLLKPEGRNPQTGTDFRNGRRICAGERMENG